MLSKCGREKFRGRGTLGAHLSAHVGAREKKKLLEPSRLVGDACEVELITACVVAYPGASDLPSHVNLRF